MRRAAARAACRQGVPPPTCRTAARACARAGGRARAPPPRDLCPMRYCLQRAGAGALYMAGAAGAKRQYGCPFPCRACAAHGLARRPAHPSRAGLPPAKVALLPQPRAQAAVRQPADRVGGGRDRGGACGWVGAGGWGVGVAVEVNACGGVFGGGGERGVGACGWPGGACAEGVLASRMRHRTHPPRARHDAPPPPQTLSHIRPQGQRAYGNRWTLIASLLPGRCNNDIKNYFNLYLKHQVGAWISGKGQIRWQGAGGNQGRRRRWWGGCGRLTQL